MINVSIKISKHHKQHFEDMRTNSFTKDQQIKSNVLIYLARLFQHLFFWGLFFFYKCFMLCTVLLSIIWPTSSMVTMAPTCMASKRCCPWRLLETGSRAAAETSWLTLSSQAQPKSSVTVETGPGGDGLDTSSGMAGLKTGLLSRWLRLPWVPLFAAGFRPRRSAVGRETVFVIVVAGDTRGPRV